MVRYLVLFLAMCSVAQAQLVSIDWPNRSVGEQVVSVRENPVRLTPEQLTAQGFMQRVDSRGKTYWAKPVMSGCETGSSTQRPMNMGSS